MRIEEAENAANPWALTLSEYSPTGRLEKRNVPCREVVTDWRNPVCAFCTLTWAPLTAASDGSVACPSRMPTGSWAHTTPHRQMSINADLGIEKQSPPECS